MLRTGLKLDHYFQTVFPGDVDHLVNRRVRQSFKFSIIDLCMFGVFC